MPDTPDTPTGGGRGPRGRFKPGSSGNPAGRPPIVRSAFEEKLKGASDGLLDKAIALANGGDVSALKLLLGMLAPPARDSHIRFEFLGSMKTAKQIDAACGRVVEAVAAGDIRPSEGEVLTRILDARLRTLQAVSIDDRIRELTKRMEMMQSKTQQG